MRLLLEYDVHGTGSDTISFEAAQAGTQILTHFIGKLPKEWHRAIYEVQIRRELGVGNFVIRTKCSAFLGFDLETRFVTGKGSSPLESVADQLYRQLAKAVRGGREDLDREWPTLDEDPVVAPSRRRRAG